MPATATATTTKKKSNGATPATTAPKKTKVTKIVDLEAGKLGVSVDGEEVLLDDVANLPYLLRVQAMFESLSRRLVAVARDAGVKGVKEQIELFQQGHFTRRTSKGGKAAYVVQALARIKGWEVSRAQSVWDGLDKQKKSHITSNTEIKKVILSIKEEERVASETGDEPTTPSLDEVLGV